MVTRPVGCGQPLPPTRVRSRIRPLQTGPSGQAYLSVKIILLSVGLFIELLQGIRRCGETDSSECESGDPGGCWPWS